MKKQFSIKPTQLLKSVTQSAAKAESTNILKFFLADDPNDPCCKGYTLPRDASMIALSR